jgi:hypothetical protein
MSWQATAYISDLTVSPTGERLTRSEKLLAPLLANRHNPDAQIAWPSVPNLAKDAMMSDRTVQRLLKSLEAKGVIAREYRWKGPRECDTTLYRFPGLDREGGGDRMSPGKISSPDRSVTRVVATRCHQGGDTTVSGKPSMNPQITDNNPCAHEQEWEEEWRQRYDQLYRPYPA